MDEHVVRRGCMVSEYIDGCRWGRGEKLGPSSLSGFACFGSSGCCSPGDSLSWILARDGATGFGVSKEKNREICGIYDWHSQGWDKCIAVWF